MDYGCSVRYVCPQARLMSRGRPFHRMAAVNNSALSFLSAAPRQMARLHIDSLGTSPQHRAACTCGGRGRGEEHGGEVAYDDRMARRGASAAALAAVVSHTDQQETRVAAVELVPMRGCPSRRRKLDASLRARADDTSINSPSQQAGRTRPLRQRTSMPYSSIAGSWTSPCSKEFLCLISICCDSVGQALDVRPGLNMELSC